MKAKLSLLAIAIAGIVVFGACDNTTSTAASSTTSPAYVAGQTFGSSLLNLYSMYKQNGKIDVTNVNTMLQLAQLATATNNIKNNLKNTDFYLSFVQGAVLGSQQKITQNSAGSIINSLTGVNFGNIAQAASGSGTVDASTVSSVTNALSSVFSLMGK